MHNCTLTKASKKLLETLEIWTWWRMLKVSWKEVTKEEVLVRANEARSILKTIWCRKHRWLGHILRHDNLLHDITEGKCWERLLGVEKWLELLNMVEERLWTAERFNPRQIKQDSKWECMSEIRGKHQKTKDHARDSIWANEMSASWAINSYIVMLAM